LTTRQADLLLLLITVLWGTTFAIVHTTTARFPPLALIALRFAIAAALLLPWTVRRVDGRVLQAGGLLGVLLFAGFATQTLGIARTTPARAGFITGLNVVFVPIVGFLLGDRISRRVAAAIAVSLAGLAVLSWGCDVPWLGCSTFESTLPERALGDRFTLLCAGAYAVHVVGVSRWTKGLPPLAVNVVQLGVVAMLAFVSALLLERPIPAPTASVWAAVVFLAVAATIVTFWLMLKVQPHTTAPRASLIYSLEAVFAALFSWIWVGEVPSLAVWLGGGLMMAAVLLLELGHEAGARAAPAAPQ
jgi:drug/metabolite transporter (DMT)-like permease